MVALRPSGVLLICLWTSSENRRSEHRDSSLEQHDSDLCSLPEYSKKPCRTSRSGLWSLTSFSFFFWRCLLILLPEVAHRLVHSGWMTAVFLAICRPSCMGIHIFDTNRPETREQKKGCCLGPSRNRKTVERWALSHMRTISVLNVHLFRFESFLREFQMDLFWDLTYPLSKNHQSNISPSSKTYPMNIPGKTFVPNWCFGLGLSMIQERILLLLQK